MVTCPTCHAEADDEAKFCSHCGTSLQTSGHLSDFEIGKIAALDSIKKDILKWFGGFGAVIAVVVAVLGYFGLNSTLQSSVTEQIKTDLKQNRDDINKAIAALYTAVGKAEKDQDTLTRTLTSSLNTAATLDSTLNTVNQQLNTLKDATSKTETARNTLDGEITKTDAKRADLDKIIQSLNIISLIGKLKYDFYHIRDFKIVIDLSVATPADPINFERTMFVKILQNTPTADDNTSSKYTLAHLTSNYLAKYTDNDVFHDVLADFTVMPMFEDRVFNYSIADLANIEAITIMMDLNQKKPTTKFNQTNI